MAFVTNLNTITPSAGVPLYQAALTKAGTSLSGTALQTTSFTSISPSIRSAKVRVKIYNGAGTSPTLVALVVNVTDGTTTETVYAMNPAVAVALSTTAWLDVTFQFLSELNVTQIDVKTTLGGTSPTASLDVQVAPGSTGNS
jgi:hypothetical protein